jgi:hypothetical protein
MRTKTLRVNSEPVECILCAGGPGFKVYSDPREGNGWVLVLGRHTIAVPREQPAYDIIGRYLMMKYHPADRRVIISDEFDRLISALTLGLDDSRTAC